MRFFKKKNRSKEKTLEYLLSNLEEIAEDPPVIIDLYDWQDNIDNAMKDIRSLSLPAYERLNDLVMELRKRGAEHVNDIDSESAPNVIEESGRRYFEQLAFLRSEIQSLRSF